jgi:protein-S-isoprenylcysteine O-methyltransferase Ste14
MARAWAALGSALFFVLAPGTVAVLVPWLLTHWEAAELPPWWWPLQVLGAIPVLAGAAVVIQAFVSFVVEGSGTPLPAAAPARLVVGSWYRYVRNPMYVGIIAAIFGQALWLGRWELLVYTLVAWAFPAAFVKWYEEPVLAKRFGAAYDEYRAAVPAWIPRLRPWTPPVDTHK